MSKANHKLKKKTERALDAPYKLYYNTVHVQAIDLGILYANLFLANADPEIGYEHANAPRKRFIKRINRIVRIRRADLESLLWSANMLFEKGKFFHPENKEFKKFVSSFQLGEYDYDFNYFKDGKKRGGDES